MNLSIFPQSMKLNMLTNFKKQNTNAIKFMNFNNCFQIQADAIAPRKQKTTMGTYQSSYKHRHRLRNMDNEPEFKTALIVDHESVLFTNVPRKDIMKNKLTNSQNNDRIGIFTQKQLKRSPLPRVTNNSLTSTHQSQQQVLQDSNLLFELTDDEI